MLRERQRDDSAFVELDRLGMGLGQRESGILMERREMTA